MLVCLMLVCLIFQQHSAGTFILVLWQLAQTNYVSLQLDNMRGIQQSSHGVSNIPQMIPTGPHFLTVICPVCRPQKGQIPESGSTT